VSIAVSIAIAFNAEGYRAALEAVGVRTESRAGRTGEQNPGPSCPVFLTTWNGFPIATHEDATARLCCK
jgi:hypothetical protein